MSGWLKRSAFRRFVRGRAVVVLPFALAACASDGARYAPPPPWSSAQQQYNQTFSQRPPVAGQSAGWQGAQNQPAWQPQPAPSWQQPGNDVTGSIQPAPQATTVYAQPLPPVTRPAAPAPAPQAQWTPPAAPPQWHPPVAAAPRAAVPAGPVRQPIVPDSGQTMTVESGQTIAGIARKYGVKPQDLMQLNGVASSDQLVIGQRLKLPKGAQAPVPLAWTQPAASPQSPRPATHTVRAGETLTSIASHYGMDAGTIAKFNNLGPSDRPRIGQKLELAAQARPIAPAVPQQVENLPTATIAPRVPEPKFAPAVVEPRKTVIAAPAPVPEPVAAPAPQAAEEVDFRWPVRGRVIAKFGRQENGGNVDGIKIAVPQGTPVRAAEAGTVVYSGSELKPYGNLILIRHAGGWVTAYAHNADLSVKNGDQVKRGQVISHAGQTGSVTQPQVHFEIRKGKTPVDPMEHLTGG